MKSKYLNQSFDNWKVIGAVKTKGNHKSFILAKRNGRETLVMTLRDNQLAKLASGQKTMDDIIAGKLYQVSKNIRHFQNMIVSI